MGLVHGIPTGEAQISTLSCTSEVDLLERFKLPVILCKNTLGLKNISEVMTHDQQPHEQAHDSGWIFLTPPLQRPGCQMYLETIHSNRIKVRLP